MITDLVFASSVENLCRKSLRMLRILLWRRASLRADFLRLFDPLTLRLCCFDKRFKRLVFLSNGFGATTFFSSEREAKWSRPTSIPKTSPFTGCGIGISFSIVKLTYHRSASRLIVAERILPSTLGFSFKVIEPKRGNWIFLFLWYLSGENCPGNFFS